jgi:predicted 3-demethylubiquinone-9 3-methyltransferase (glyoxalase superfamily)
MPKIATSLWFDGNAEEAAEYYCSLFADSKITDILRVDGAVLTVMFELEGQAFMALNGGPQFKFDEAVSVLVTTDSQEETDRLWNELTDGGEESMCGWLKDRFGLSWQIVPSELSVLMADPDPSRAARVREALLQMRKIDLAKLREARDGADQ